LTIFSFRYPHSRQTASALVKNADNAIKQTTMAIAVKPKPRLDALLITNLSDTFCYFN
jgi:hypothetical protein